MALIDIKDMSKLIAANSARAVAQSAEYDQQLGTVAYQINQAANTGEYRCFVSGELRDDVKSKLAAEGYVVTPAGIAKETDRYVIDWRP